MKILISGMHGFIGSHLAIRLKNLGHNVCDIPTEIFSYHETELERFLQRFDPDQIYNLATYGNYYHHDDLVDAKMTKFANIDIPFRLMIFLNPKTTLFQFSSSSVLLANQTIYSATKRAAELLCHAYSKKFGLDVRVIRPYSVYGPNDNDVHFIPTVIKKIITGEEMLLAPNAIHDWIYIDDFIDAILKGECTIGTGIKTKNIEIVKLLEKISGKKLKYTENNHLRSYDNEDWVAKFAVKHRSIEEGLKLTYDYYYEKFRS
jgi:nucleoside-diphosphate-sugar epimerase